MGGAPHSPELPLLLITFLTVTPTIPCTYRSVNYVLTISVHCPLVTTVFFRAAVQSNWQKHFSLQAKSVRSDFVQAEQQQEQWAEEDHRPKQATEAAVLQWSRKRRHLAALCGIRPLVESCFWVVLSFFQETVYF